VQWLQQGGCDRVWEGVVWKCFGFCGQGLWGFFSNIGYFFLLLVVTLYGEIGLQSSGVVEWFEFVYVPHWQQVLWVQGVFLISLRVSLEDGIGLGGWSAGTSAASWRI
jgi:hypothetical protein